MPQVLEVTVDFAGKEANEVIVQKIMSTHAIETFFDYRVDIKTKEQLALNTVLRRVIRSYTGCGFDATDNAVNIYQKFLEVCKLKINLEQCAEDIASTFFVKMMKTGADIDNLEGTEVENFIIDRVVESITLDLPELAWFGDVDSSDDFLSSCDGIWKRIFEAIAEYSGQRVYAFDADLGDCEAYEAMKAMFTDAPAELDSRPESEKQILLTRELYDNFVDCLAQPCCNDRSWEEIGNGKKQMYFKGIPVYKMTEWTEAIRHFNLDFPHRAIYTMKGNFVAGTDAVSDEQQIKFWYDENSELNKIKVKMKFGTQILYNNFTVVAY